MTQTNRWMAKNLGGLVDLYGGRYVAVCGRRVLAVGRTESSVERQGRARAGGKEVSVVRIPALRDIGQEFDPIRLFRLS